MILPPTPAQTSEDCKDGEIWDEKTPLCVAPDTTDMNDDQRFLAGRELAYAGRPEDALRVLASMQDARTDRVLTCLGFANRKAGRRVEGLAFYAPALIQNPDNTQAWSYFGQAYVDLGGTGFGNRRDGPDPRARRQGKLGRGIA